MAQYHLDSYTFELFITFHFSFHHRKSVTISYYLTINKLPNYLFTNKKISAITSNSVSFHRNLANPVIFRRKLTNCATFRLNFANRVYVWRKPVNDAIFRYSFAKRASLSEEEAP